MDRLGFEPLDLAHSTFGRFPHDGDTISGRPLKIGSFEQVWHLGMHPERLRPGRGSTPTETFGAHIEVLVTRTDFDHFVQVHSAGAAEFLLHDNTTVSDPVHFVGITGDEGRTFLDADPVDGHAR